MFYHPTWNVDELIDVLQSYDVAGVLDAWGQWSTSFCFPSGPRIMSQDMRVPILVHACVITVESIRSAAYVVDAHDVYAVFETFHVALDAW